MDEKQLQKLIKKNIERAEKPKKQPRRTYDPTLDITRGPETDADQERNEFFDQMKKREF